MFVFLNLFAGATAAEKSKPVSPAKPAFQSSSPTKSKVANNFEDQLDDPDFNPFETKSKVVNDRMEEEDPNFNPFATKSKVMNDEDVQVIMFFKIVQ